MSTSLTLLLTTTLLRVSVHGMATDVSKLLSKLTTAEVGAALGLVGVAELADLLDVSRPRASVIGNRRDFAEPVAVLRAGPVWLRRDIERWLAEKNKPS